MGGNVTAFSTVVDGQHTLRSGDALRLATKPVAVGRALYFVVGQVSTANPYPPSHCTLLCTISVNTFWGSISRESTCFQLPGLIHNLAVAAGCEVVGFVLKRQAPVVTVCLGKLVSFWASALHASKVQFEAGTSK